MLSLILEYSTPVSSPAAPGLIEEVQAMNIDLKRTIGNDVIYIGDMHVDVNDVAMPNDHEASSNNSSSKYLQSRRCPLGLTCN